MKHARRIIANTVQHTDRRYKRAYVAQLPFFSSGCVALTLTLCGVVAGLFAFVVLPLAIAVTMSALTIAVVVPAFVTNITIATFFVTWAAISVLARCLYYFDLSLHQS